MKAKIKLVEDCNTSEIKKGNWIVQAEI